MGHHGSHSHHGHNHEHEHKLGHHHDHVAGQSQSVLALAAVLTGLFMGAEVVGGLISGSLALIADAGHMLTDFAALVLAWTGFSLAKRPVSSTYTFGFGRFPILSAFVNGLTLVFISVWICVAAVKRFMQPGEVLAEPMLVVAAAGLAVNLLVFWILTRGDKNNLNMRGAILHVIGDLLGSVAAIIAALIIMATGWMPIDPLLSVIVALLILRSAVFLMKESGHILLQGAPRGMDKGAIKQDLLAHVPDVKAIEHIHIWSLTAEQPMMTLHVLMNAKSDMETTSTAVKSRLHDVHHIDHVTMEMTRATVE
ncbi:MAG: cation diffusion facilitator family transporter [Maricaulaceae bacterium]